MKKIIHVCFSESTRASLKYALNTKIIRRNKVIVFYLIYLFRIML
ncbi:DUF1835 domain-containing protein [Clostridium sp. KNHs214]|nr:DUF1835 domain-containing protein [Clostridium sp. KNHs214]